MSWLRTVGRYARGDFLTPAGKRVFCLGIGAVCFMLALAIPSARAELTLAGWGLFCGFLLNAWIEFDPFANDCDGSGRRMYRSPSGEVSIGVCHDCEGWLIGIRGDLKRDGRGRDDLLIALRELGDTHAVPLPEIAAELREAADRIESFDPEEGLTKEFLPPVDQETEKAIRAAMEALGPHSGIKGAVVMDADEMEKYAEDRLAELLRGRSTPEAARDPEVQALLHSSGPVAPVQGVTPEDEGGSSSDASRGPDRPAQSQPREGTRVDLEAMSREFHALVSAVVAGDQRNIDRHLDALGNLGLNDPRPFLEPAQSQPREGERALTGDQRQALVKLLGPRGDVLLRKILGEDEPRHYDASG